MDFSKIVNELVSNKIKEIEEKDNSSNTSETITFTYKSRNKDKYNNRAFRISDKVYERWENFTKEWDEYKVQELVCQALTEFMDNHKKKQKYYNRCNKTV